MPILLAKKADQTSTPLPASTLDTSNLTTNNTSSISSGSTFNSTDSSFNNNSTSFQNGSFGSNNSYQSSGQYQTPMNLTGAGDNAATGAQVLVENDNTDWINRKWRPAMGWVYLLTCVCDFVIFPILWSILQAVSKGQVTSQWQPVTLMGAGLYHVSMGAIIGITAYGRTQEKLANKQ
jgi:hypothetical protein